MYFLVPFHISLSFAHRISHSPITSASCWTRQGVGPCALVTQFLGADSGLFILKPGGSLCVYVDTPFEPDCLWHSLSSGRGGAWIPYILSLPSTVKLSRVSWLARKNQTDSRSCPTGLQIIFNIFSWPSIWLWWEPFMNEIISGIPISESGNKKRGVTMQTHADIVYNIGRLSQGFSFFKV